VTEPGDGPTTMTEGPISATAPAAGAAVPGAPAAGATAPGEPAADVAVDAILAPLPSTLPPAERRATMPPGFAAGATSAGIKASGRPDLALVQATTSPAAAAAVFTTNQVVAAPVEASRANLAITRPEGRGRGGDHHGRAQAIVATSGCANAATGLAGLADQVAIAHAVATHLHVDPTSVLSLSTGVIGARLPVAAVVAGIATLSARGLASDDAALAEVAEALRTTDSVAKAATTRVELPGRDGRPVAVTVTGVAKGVGMIHPRMATMLAVLLTDAVVSPATLHGLLRDATVRTWNQLSVDGDTSTNDTVFLLASGTSAAGPVLPDTPEAAALGASIEAVARELARQQAADGEGATTLVTCQVSGARDDVDARAVARAVISSSLVKAAVHGRDPNWGRIAGAAGNARLGEVRLLEMAGLAPETARRRVGAPAFVDPDRMRIAIAGHLVCDGPAGGPVAFDRAIVRAAMDAPEVLVRLDLGLGEGTGEAFGCDLTEQYVIENAEYTT
jgi:glutamate N-acetyltransferase / amino-acid N-acetyltransferase